VPLPSTAIATGCETFVVRVVGTPIPQQNFTKYIGAKKGYSTGIELVRTLYMNQCLP
jgi:hypothetical protein